MNTEVITQDKENLQNRPQLDQFPMKGTWSKLSSFCVLRVPNAEISHPCLS